MALTTNEFITPPSVHVVVEFVPNLAVPLAALRLMQPRIFHPDPKLLVSLYALNLISNTHVVSAGITNLLVALATAPSNVNIVAVALVVTFLAIKIVC